MKIRYKDENIELSQEQLDFMYEAEGNESIVYRFKRKNEDKALKIYKKQCLKDRIDMDVAKKLSNIKTERIMMPDTLIYDDNEKFIGYTTPYKNRYSLEHISLIKKDKIKEELKKMYMDIEKLSDEHVDLEDLHRDNIILNDGIYICDPGSFKILEDIDKRITKTHNKKILREFIIQEILKYVTKMTKKEQLIFERHFNNESEILEIIDNEMEQNETLKNYVRKIAKEKKY